MPRFAANVSMLFDDVPFLDRFARAAQAGFEAVECQFPYGHDARSIRDQLDANSLTMVLHNLPPGDHDAGERGIACLPDRVPDFKRSVQQGIEMAYTLGVRQLNCLAGKAPIDADPELLRRTLVSNLKYAAKACAKAKLKLLVEPINAHDVPGYFVNTTAQAIEILDEVGAPNGFVQYDVYHAQRTEGDLATTLRRHLARIGHIQVADAPGRHEPGTGEINFAYLFAHLDRIGYGGWVGCEYRPRSTTQAGLSWRQRLLR